MRRLGVILACSTTGILLAVARHSQGEETALPRVSATPVARALDQPIPATAQISYAPRKPVDRPENPGDRLETLVLNLRFRSPDADPRPMEASLGIRYRVHAPRSDVLRFASRYETEAREELVKILERQGVGPCSPRRAPRRGRRLSRKFDVPCNSGCSATGLPRLRDSNT